MCMDTHHHCFTLLFLQVLRSVWTQDLQVATAIKVWDWLQTDQAKSQVSDFLWGRKSNQIKTVQIFFFFFSPKMEFPLDMSTSMRNWVLMLEPPRQFVSEQGLVTFCVLNSASSRRAKMPKSFNLRRLAVTRYLRTWVVFHSGGLFILENIMDSSGSHCTAMNERFWTQTAKQSILFAGSFTISKSFSETVVLTAW